MSEWSGRAQRTALQLHGARVASAANALAVRELRDIGGPLELIDETEGVQATTVVDDWGRVFAFRPAVAALALLAALSGAAAPARADVTDARDPAVVLSRVIERNPDLSSYQSRVHVDLRLVSFPYLRQHLDGSTYFKRPANCEVIFDRVPAYAKGFEQLYSDVGDPSNWERRFVISYAGEVLFENRTDVALQLVQRVRGMIDHETVLIDPNAWNIDQIRYDYYNGGVVTMTQHFSNVGAYTMLSAQTVDIKIPHVHAVANATYTDYQTNVAISDAVFSEKSKPQR